MVRVHNIFGGGSQTNTNGLSFERDTSLEDALTQAGYNIKNREVYDKNDNKIGLSIPKNSLYKEFLENKNIDYKLYNSKKWLPDEAFYNFKTNTIYIIEKKYQQSSGSVDEKLPNCDFKKKEYQKLFNPLNIQVNYIYIFNNWFKHQQYKDVLEYILDVGCEYYYNKIPFESLGLEKDN